MIIHCHYSTNPISGEMKRIMNINNDVAAMLSPSIIEVEFFSVRQWKYVMKFGQFTLSDKVVKKYYVPIIPSLRFINDWYQILVMSLLMLCYSPTHIISEWYFPIGVKVLKKIFNKTRFILDVHGALPEEYVYLHDKRSTWLERVESNSMLNADTIICQSNEMKRHIYRKFNLNHNVVIYRCGVDIGVFKRDNHRRISLRKNLGYNENDIVFVYSGGMHKWQRVEDVLVVFSKYHSYNRNSKLLVLTKETESFRDKLNKFADSSDVISACQVYSLSYNEVPDYLNAADVAFLLRDNDIMNAVASPTKLSEYLACGLPVISTRVSDVWLDTEGLKYLFNIDEESIQQITSFVNDISSDQVVDYAINNLSLEIDRVNVKRYFMAL